MSLPTWGRGLKLNLSAGEIDNDKSLPTWGRGLKQREKVEEIKSAESLPTWGRGLKQTWQGNVALPICRSLHGGVD